jgi:hypothetical protein
MWLLSGSLLFRGNVCKKAYVFLGSEGDNGKSTFTELIQLTLGDYAVTGNRSALSGAHDQATLDPDLVANCKSLVCTFPEVQCVENGVGAGFKFNCGKLKALTGQDEQSCRGLYRDKRGVVIGVQADLALELHARGRLGRRRGAQQAVGGAVWPRRSQRG